MAESSAAKDVPADLPQRFEKLKAQATQQYSLKNYSAAADFYSEAAEVQDEINGEMSIENADLLYHYGRCLYHVAVQNSDVLGSKVASSEEPKRKKRKVTDDGGVGSSGQGSSAVASGSVIGDAISGSEGKVPGQEATKSKDAASESKPFFQITGDENWTDSEGEDEDDDAAQEEAEEEDDDFATAYEILDMARVLLARKLEAVKNNTGETTAAAEVRQIEERLADTHDLQAEIALENERFTDAINDTRDALALKLHLYPPESSLVAEAHFKLSLALEFASVTSTEEAADGSKVAAAVDENMRAEAAAEMEKAIASCKSRIAKETQHTQDQTSEKGKELLQQIEDIKGMVAEMEERLVDLRKPATSLSGLQGAGEGEQDAIRGVLGALLGENKAGQQKLLEQATEKANDLTGLVKKGKKKQTEAEVAGTGAVGKRKAEESILESAENAPRSNSNAVGKRVKFEDQVADTD